MKVLLIDNDGVGLAFAWRCQQNGHMVRWFIAPKKHNNQDTGKGFKGIEKIDNWVGSAMWADLIFNVSNDDFLPRLEMMKARGAKYFGPSVKSANLEIKRADGMLFLEEHGISVPDYKVFKNLKEAEAYVWKHDDKRYVFKTLGDNEDKALSYVAKTPADMIARLRRWQELKLNPKGEVMLQEFVAGIEFAVSRWMGKSGWVGPANENFEFKKFCAGDVGCNTGEMGSVLKYVNESKLFDETLGKLDKSLKGLGHLGDVDLNCIIDGSGKVWPLEFTSRPGWPAFNIMLSEHSGDPVKWMKDAIEGKDSLTVSEEVAIGVVISQPDFPYSQYTKKEVSGVPFYVEEKQKKYIQPQGIKIENAVTMEGDRPIEKPMWVTSGDYIAVVTGLGKTVKEAQKRVYGTVEKIHVSNMMYRHDIGDRLEKQIPELQKHGFAKEWRFE